jgi:hypothetical protein
MLEFHISRSARDRYEVEETLFGLRGNVVITNFNAARSLAQKINAKRDLVKAPEQAVSAAQLNAMGLLDEINHLVIAQYHQQTDGGIWAKALDWLETRLGKLLCKLSHRFVDSYRGIMSR